MQLDRIDEKYRRFPSTLRAAGIDVPAEYTAALDVGQWEPTRPTTNAEYERLYAAGNAEERQAAATALARAHADVQAYRDSNFVRDLTDFRVATVESAFRSVRGDLYPALCGRFNGLAPDFEDAVSRMPDLETVKPLDFTPDHAAGVATAKGVATELRKVWTAYRAILELSSDAVGSGREIEEAYDIAAYLGEYSSSRNFNLAGELIRQHAHGNDTAGVLRLAPFYAVAYYGNLRMLPPAEAGRRREALFTDAVIAERQYSPFAYPGVPTDGELKPSAVAA